MHKLISSLERNQYKLMNESCLDIHLHTKCSNSLSLTFCRCNIILVSLESTFSTFCFVIFNHVDLGQKMTWVLFGHFRFWLRDGIFTAVYRWDLKDHNGDFITHLHILLFNTLESYEWISDLEALIIDRYIYP